MRLSARATLALAIAAGGSLVPIACSSEDALVGGACAPGYAPCGTDCCPVSDGSVDATARDGSLRDGDGAAYDAHGDADGYGGSDADGPPSDALFFDRMEPDHATGDGPTADAPGSDGSTDGGPLDAPEDSPQGETSVPCTPPLVDCGGVCVDTTSDPSNCGGCGIVCPSQLCVASMCVGSTAGGCVFIGHDYQTTPTGTSQARILSNSAGIEGAAPKILAYERYANPNAVARVDAILANASITATVTDSDIPNELTVQSFGVLLVHDQPTAASGAMAILGSGWASTLSTFMQAGGLVIVLDGGTGVGEMDAFATAAGVLDVASQSPIATGTRLEVVAPGDAVGIGVISPYGAGTHSVLLGIGSDAGSAVDVVDLPGDAGSFFPVVIHRAL